MTRRTQYHLLLERRLSRSHELIKWECKQLNRSARHAKQTQNADQSASHATAGNGQGDAAKCGGN